MIFLTFFSKIQLPRSVKCDLKLFQVFNELRQLGGAESIGSKSASLLRRIAACVDTNSNPFIPAGRKKPGYLNRLGWINIGPMKTDWPSDGQRPPVAAPISAQHTEPQTAATGRYFHFAASQQAEAAVPYFWAGQHADASNASRQHGDVRRNHRIVPLTSPSVARFIQRRPSLICPSHCGHQSHFVPVGSLLRAACSTNSWRPLFHSELPHSFENVLKLIKMAKNFMGSSQFHPLGLSRTFRQFHPETWKMSKTRPRNLGRNATVIPAE